MTVLIRIAERVFNRPLLVHPDKVPLILAVLNGRIPIGNIDEMQRTAEASIADLPEDAQRAMLGPRASRFVGESYETDAEGKRVKALPYKRTADGVGIITVTGSLINRGAWIGSCSGETSYEGIKFQLASAVADPKVKSILLDIESPGGEATGAFEAASAVRAAAQQKSVTAVVNGMAASAAYALASGADRIITTPSGVSGSIGVVLLHADFSRALDKEGITPTLIFAGAHKVDGNPFEPLPDGVREDLQREVNQYYQTFVQTVADGRSRRMSPAAIRGTEARTFIGQEAVDAGLADEVGTFESALAEISTARLRASKGAMMMAKENGQPGANAAGNEATATGTPATTAALATPAAATNEADRAAIEAQARKDGVTAERARQKAIIGSEEAKGRETLANHLAFETDMSADAAKAVLAAAPKPEPAKASKLDTLMAGKTPAIDGRPASEGKPGEGLTAAVDRLVASRFGKDAVAH